MLQLHLAVAVCAAAAAECSYFLETSSVSCSVTARAGGGVSVGDSQTCLLAAQRFDPTVSRVETSYDGNASRPTGCYIERAANGVDFVAAVNYRRASTPPPPPGTPPGTCGMSPNDILCICATPACLPPPEHPGSTPAPPQGVEGGAPPTPAPPTPTPTHTHTPHAPPTPLPVDGSGSGSAGDVFDSLPLVEPVSAASLVVSGVAVLAVPSSVGGAAGLLAVAFDSRCGSPEQSVRTALHPTGVLGFETAFGSRHAAALLGNLAILAAAALPGTLFTLCTRACGGATAVPRAQGWARFPSHAIAAFTLLYPGIAMASLQLLFYGISKELTVLGGLGASLCVGLPLWLAWKSVTCVPKHASYRGGAGGGADGCLPPCGRAWLLGEGVWVSTDPARDPFAKRYSAVLSPYREETCWGLLVEFAPILAAAALAVPRPSSASICGTMRLLLGLLFVVAMAGKLWLQVYAKTRDTAMHAVRLACISLGLILAAIGFYSSGGGGSWAFSVAAVFLIAAALTIVAQVVMDVAAACLSRGSMARLEAADGMAGDAQPGSPEEELLHLGGGTHSMEVPPLLQQGAQHAARFSSSSATPPPAVVCESLEDYTIPPGSVSSVSCDFGKTVKEEVCDGERGGSRKSSRSTEPASPAEGGGGQQQQQQQAPRSPVSSAMPLPPVRKARVSPMEAGGGLGGKRLSLTLLRPGGRDSRSPQQPSLSAAGGGRRPPPRRPGRSQTPNLARSVSSTSVNGAAAPAPAAAPPQRLAPAMQRAVKEDGLMLLQLQASVPNPLGKGRQGARHHKPFPFPAEFVQEGI